MTMPLTEPGTVPPTLVEDPLWWRSAVIYQVYVRSFADGRRRHRRPARRAQPARATSRTSASTRIWFNPWYPSPARRRRLRRRGLPRHPPAPSAPSRRPSCSSARRSRSASARSSTSSRTTSRASTRGSRRRSPPGPGSPERERFWFHPGKGPNGDEMPDALGLELPGRRRGRAPTNPDGTPGEWYLHLFTPEQPDLNWNHPDVRARARGHPALLVRPRRRGRAHRLGGPAHQGPRAARGAGRGCAPAEHPTEDRDELHDVYRVVAAHRRLVHGHARARRRGLGARRRALRRLPAARRDAHGVQLRLHVAARGMPRSSATRST